MRDNSSSPLIYFPIPTLKFVFFLQESLVNFANRKIPYAAIGAVDITDAIATIDTLWLRVRR